MNYNKRIGFDNVFSLGDRYRLNLKWDKAVYNVEGVCDLYGASFSGPVLSIAEPIAPNDSINLDFYKQYYILVRSVYVATLHWGEVTYKDGFVLLSDAKITHDTELNKAPKLNNSDYIIINTEGHDSSNNSLLFSTYEAFVVDSDSNLYNFVEKTYA